MGVIEVTVFSKTTPSTRYWYQERLQTSSLLWLQGLWWISKVELGSAWMQEEATLSARFNCLLVVTKCKNIIQRFDIVFDLNFFSQKIEQSNFCIFWCQFRVKGVVLDEKVTSKTPIKIKSYLLGTIFSHFYWVLGAKNP